MRRRIQKGDFVLIDLWAKLDKPDAVYSDLTRVAYVGENVPEVYTKVFDIVAAGRDAGIDCVKKAYANIWRRRHWYAPTCRTREFASLAMRT